MIVRPHGETNITLACQNSCVACNHAIPAQKAWFIKPADFKKDMQSASKIVHFDRYNLVGGEPTLHSKIIDLLEIVKASGIADTLEITTNGQSIQNMPDRFFEILDELIVTPYKLSDPEIEYIKSKCYQFNLALQWHPVIFTEYAYREKSPDDVARGRYNACWYNVNRHVIDNGYFYRCCTAPFIPFVLMGLPKETDGIAIEGLTEQGLNDYLHDPHTPASCYVCASNCGQRIEWRECSREDWLKESVR